MNINILKTGNSKAYEKGRIRIGISATQASGGGRLRPLGQRPRVRVSLMTGSAFVLASLVLPFTYDSCGSVKAGYEFVKGDGAWPGLPMLASAWGARVFYGFTLSFAMLTAVLVFNSFWRAAGLQDTRLIRGAHAVAGAVSLFSISNLAWALVFTWVLDGTGERTQQAVALISWLAPVALWFRYGLFGKGPQTARWNAMRTRIFVLYCPLVAVDFYLLVLTALGGLWGFVGFFAGTQLLALGYMRLAQEANARQTEKGLAESVTISEMDAVPVV